MKLPAAAASVALATALAAASTLARGDELDSIQERIETLQRQYEQYRRELMIVERRLNKLQSAMQARGRGAPKTAGTLSQAAPSAPAAGADSPPAAEDEAVVKEPARSASAQSIYTQQGSVFESKFTFEPALTYSRFDRRLINLSGFLALDAIFLGSIDVQQTKSDLWTLDLTGRWGVTPQLQLDANVPYLYRDSNFFSGGAGGAAGTLSEASVSKSGVGDISVGAYYQIWQESATRPDLILNARLKAPTGKEPYGIKVIQPDPANNNLSVPESLPTGSGVWSASVGLTAIKTADPAILFGSVGLIHNFPRHFEDISTSVNVTQPGDVDLRNALTWGVGVGFAINEKMAISFAFNDLIQQAARTKNDGGAWTNVVGSDANAASFNFGLTYALGQKSTLITNVGIGLTPDAPDFSISVRVPYTF